MTTGEQRVGEAARIWRDRLRERRSWAPFAVVFAMGVADLVLRGWYADGRVLLLGGVVVAALIAGQRAGWVAWGTAGAVSLIYGASGARPVYRLPQSVSPAVWLVGVGVFLVSGLVALWASSPPKEWGEGEAPAPKAEDLSDSSAEILSVPIEDGGQIADPALQRRADDLEASLSVARSFWAPVDLSTLLNRACEAISEHFDFHLVMVYLLDDGGRSVTLRGASSVAGKALVLRGFHLQFGSGDPVEKVALGGEPLAVPISERQHHAALAPLLAPETQATLLLPLRVGDRLLGILELHSSREDDLQPRGGAVLQQLVDHLAAAIERVQHVGGSDVAIEPGDQTYQTASKLITAQSERDVLEAMLRAVDAYRPAQSLIVEASRDQETETGGALCVVAQMQHGTASYDAYDLLGSEEDGHGRHTTPRRQALPLDAASFADIVILGLTLEQPLWVEDLLDLDPGLNPELRGALVDLVERLEAARANWLWDATATVNNTAAVNDTAVQGVSLPRALMFAPLHGASGAPTWAVNGTAAVNNTAAVKNTAGGILVLYDRVHTFSTVERHLHQLLTDLGGAALRQQRRYADVQRRAARATLLASIRERLWRAEDAEAVMRTAAVELGRAVDAEAVMIEIPPAPDVPTRPMDPAHSAANGGER